MPNAAQNIELLEFFFGRHSVRQMPSWLYSLFSNALWKFVYHTYKTVLSTHATKKIEVLSSKTKSISYMAKSMLLYLCEAAVAQTVCWSAD